MPQIKPIVKFLNAMAIRKSMKMAFGSTKNLVETGFNGYKGADDDHILNKKGFPYRLMDYGWSSTRDYNLVLIFFAMYNYALSKTNATDNTEADAEMTQIHTELVQHLQKPKNIFKALIYVKGKDTDKAKYAVKEKNLKDLALDPTKLSEVATTYKAIITKVVDAIFSGGTFADKTGKDEKETKKLSDRINKLRDTQDQMKAKIVKEVTKRLSKVTNWVKNGPSVASAFLFLVEKWNIKMDNEAKLKIADIESAIGTTGGPVGDPGPEPGDGGNLFPGGYDPLGGIEVTEGGNDEPAEPPVAAEPPAPGAPPPPPPPGAVGSNSPKVHFELFGIKFGEAAGAGDLSQIVAWDDNTQRDFNGHGELFNRLHANGINNIYFRRANRQPSPFVRKVDGQGTWVIFVGSSVTKAGFCDQLCRYLSGLTKDAQGGPGAASPSLTHEYAVNDNVKVKVECFEKSIFSPNTSSGKNLAIILPALYDKKKITKVDIRAEDLFDKIEGHGESEQDQAAETKFSARLKKMGFAQRQGYEMGMAYKYEGDVLIILFHTNDFTGVTLRKKLCPFLNEEAGNPMKVDALGNLVEK